MNDIYAECENRIKEKDKIIKLLQDKQKNIDKFIKVVKDHANDLDRVQAMMRSHPEHFGKFENTINEMEKAVKELRVATAKIRE